VLARLDEASYAPGDGAMGSDHPIAWSHAFEGGRAWYTGGGHTSESYSEPLFLAHLLGGIRFAAAPAPPAIRSVAASVQARRLVVTVRFSSCLRCAGEAAVRVGRRERSVALRAQGAIARAVLTALPRGRWPLRISLEDRATGRRATVRRSILVR
jgi:Trehalose utilisation